MHRTQPMLAAPYEESVSTQPDCATNLYEMSSTSPYEMASASPYEMASASPYEMASASPYEMAESMETEQQIYETPCEGEESIGPIYCVPPTNEEKIYEEFEGKRFHKIHQKELM